MPLIDRDQALAGAAYGVLRVAVAGEPRLGDGEQLALDALGQPGKQRRQVPEVDVERGPRQAGACHHRGGGQRGIPGLAQQRLGAIEDFALGVLGAAPQPRSGCAA